MKQPDQTTVDTNIHCAQTMNVGKFIIIGIAIAMCIISLHNGAIDKLFTTLWGI